MGAGSSRPPLDRAGARLKLAPTTEPRFEFLESLITVPELRPGTVSRTALVNRLRATRQATVATLTAPAGYGKTTLLAQWAERDPRSFGWVTVDDRDNDPVVLLRHIAAALERNAPLGSRLVSSLQSPRPSIWTAALPRLAAEVAARAPFVLVLDDFNLLRSRASLEAVGALIGDEAEGSLLVVAGRVLPRLPLAPLRASGRLFELGPAGLAMTKRESELLLREAGVELEEERIAELVEACEGWPAALYLAALSIRDAEGDDREVGRFGGDDRYLADYFRSEYLSRLRPGPLRFLRRTSVLDRMCGPLCDFVLDDDGSAGEFEKIERANLFLVPLDNRRDWYRYHHLFRDLLQRELAELEPELVPLLHGRAADWFEQHDDPESALEHAYAAGDADRAAELLASIAIPLYYSARLETLERWLRRFERAGLLERYPEVALHCCRVHILAGRREEAVRWLEAAEAATPDNATPELRGRIATVRSCLCRQGPKRMLADAKVALALLREDSDWRPTALLTQGAAAMLLGDSEQADSALDAAAEAGAHTRAAESWVIAVGLQALLAEDSMDHDRADWLTGVVHELVASRGVQGYHSRATELAASVRTMLRHGRWNQARTALVSAGELVPHLTATMPWLAVLVQLELAAAFAALRDATAAQELLDRARGLMETVPGLDGLAARAEALEAELAALPKPDDSHGAGLTPAELRLLPLLATHLSFREIAAQLYVSRNTIKTQAISVYRKLGVSSRSDAVAEAHRLGLGEHLHVTIDDR